MPQWKKGGNRPTSSDYYIVKATDGVREWEEELHYYICPEYGFGVWETLEDEDFTYKIIEWKEKW